MKISDQMIAAIMMALQNSLQTQEDIVPEFKRWNLYMKGGEIFVDNPPIIEVNEDFVEEFADDFDVAEFLETDS